MYISYDECPILKVCKFKKIENELTFYFFNSYDFSSVFLANFPSSWFWSQKFAEYLERHRQFATNSDKIRGPAL
jgi:hypothetical protein